LPLSGNNLPLIAIIDSGIYTGNKYLNKNNIDQIIFDNLSNSANQEHGTHVAGLIIGRGNGRTTPQGLLPDTKLLSIQVGSSVGMSSEQLAQAIDLAIQRDAKIINISQGAIESTPVLELSVQNALSKGTIIVAAAGNDNSKKNDYPAAFPDVIAVSTLKRNGETGVNTNYESFNISAPGEKLLTTGSSQTDSIKYFSGSSAATPVVTSICAIIASYNVSLTSREVKHILLESSRTVLSEGKEKIHILDANSAIKMTQLYR
jgi:subtilisin family serine protease